MTKARIDKDRPFQERQQMFLDFFREVHDPLIESAAAVLSGIGSDSADFIRDHAKSESDRNVMLAKLFYEFYCARLFSFFDLNCEEYCIVVRTDSGEWEPFNKSSEYEVGEYFFDMDPPAVRDSIVGSYSQFSSIMTEVIDYSRRKDSEDN